MLNLPVFVLSGSPSEMGRTHGRALSREIRAFTEGRMLAARSYLYVRGIRQMSGLLRAGAACLEAYRQHDPAGWSEVDAIASAAGVDAVRLFTACNLTDVRDVLLAQVAELGAERVPALRHRAHTAETEGCSTALVPAALCRDGVLHAAQTWDLNPEDLAHVVAFDRRPDQGPRAITVTTVGAPVLMGMNAHGVAFGTTNIKTRDARPGVPYLGLLGLMARAVDRAAAIAAVERAPRAAAHTYWAADAGGASDLECSASASVRRDLGRTALNRTNHCLDTGIAAQESEAPTTSSRARLARVASWLARGEQDVASLKALLADRSDGVDSISRLAEDDQGTTTNACVIAVPERREIHCCRGPADRGAWQTFRL